MDFELTDTQRAVRDGAQAVLTRRAGPDRARQFKTGYDRELEDDLRSAGYLAMAQDPEAGALAATILVEDAGRALASVSIGALALVGPALGIADGPGPLVLAGGDRTVPARYGLVGGRAAVAAAGGVFVHEIRAAEPVHTISGLPYGRLSLGPGRLLDGADPSQMVAWWRLAVAGELVGTMSGAFDQVVDHLRNRVQFDRPLASLQAIQHRLSQLVVKIEGSRWLAYEAAWQGAPPERAALALSHAGAAGRLAVRELHQLCGAIGLTEEYDLHLWTTRVTALCTELGGVAAQQQDVARMRWAR